VPESEAKQLRNQIRELQRLLGKKTLECEILKEAIELTRAPKKLLLRSRSQEPGGGQ
jgi:transposase